MAPPDGRPAREATEAFAERLRNRAIGNLRFDASERRRMLRLLREIEREIVDALREHDPTAVTRTAAQQRRLQRLLTDARERISRLIRRVRTSSVDALGEYAAAEAAWTQAALQRAVSGVGLDISIKLASTEVLRALASDPEMVGRPLKDWWSGQSRRIQTNFAQQMRLGIGQGETLDQLVRRVRGTRAGGFRDGLMRIPTREAEALVRTSVNQVGNAARRAVFEANADIITAYVHSSVLDNRTSLTCSARDGKAWGSDREPIGGHKIPYQMPPLHVNCRSVLLPRIGNVGRIPGERASQDGPVPASQTFETWLRAKTRAEQNAILGVSRARLWRENRLTLTQLLDFRGDPLSLEQLRTRYPD